MNRKVSSLRTTYKTNTLAPKSVGSSLVLSCCILCVSGGFWAGVPDGEEGGGAGGADGLVEDDVRDTELLTILSRWRSEHPQFDVI